MADNSKMRQEQKRQSRLRNNKTTIQISISNKDKIKKIQAELGFDSIDETIDEIVSEYNYVQQNREGNKHDSD
ncbi:MULTISPECIES: hypothetical protein [Pseudoalteromonas]|uniref:hypothetical protein n=1 Tax=Pseudoalteromonas TaxID=53246 RepID=UPI0010221F9B|nr:hypothetical protein [Pseudoalteromonas sp. MEBiC 03485]RZD19657.1 hypothetical protein EVU92_20875 [Pseudoalteromonas sp. MEBiC 03485]